MICFNPKLELCDISIDLFRRSFASNLIAEISLAIQNELTLESIHETIHAHPTESEAWLEASLIGDEIPIHYPPAKR